MATTLQHAGLAMNTIPITLDERKPVYTVIGGNKIRSKGESPLLSVIILNRGPKLYRPRLLEELEAGGFASVLSVEAGSPSLELDGLATRFPQARFLCMEEASSPGDMLNAGMRESPAPYVLVMWNDQRLGSGSFSSRFIDRIFENDILCLIPEVNDQDDKGLPVISHPAMEKKHIRIVSLAPNSDGEKSLLPFDYSGIYSREKFIMLGGYDWTIKNNWWQKTDFGFRAWLWGETIQHAQAFKLKYQGSSPAEDMTADRDYGRFWLKNLAPVYTEDRVILYRKSFFRFLARSGYGVYNSLKEFNSARHWVKHNQYRFRQDALMLAELWDPIQ